MHIGPLFEKGVVTARVCEAAASSNPDMSNVLVLVGVDMGPCARHKVVTLGFILVRIVERSHKYSDRFGETISVD